MSHCRLDAGGQAVWCEILDSADEILRLLGSIEVVIQSTSTAFIYHISIVDAVCVC